MNDMDAGLPAKDWSVESSDFGRVVSLSDGVFAFALTLLAVTITLPALDAARVNSDLPLALWNLRFAFLVYALAFAIVYVKWNTHRRLFRILNRYDNRLLLLNALFLLFISAISLPANVIGTYGDQPGAVIFFAAYQVVTALVEVVMWHYATFRHRLIAPEIPDSWLGINALRLWLAILVFIVSIPLALWNTSVAKYSWLLLFAITPVSQWLAKGKPARRENIKNT